MPSLAEVGVIILVLCLNQITQSFAKSVSHVPANQTVVEQSAQNCSWSEHERQLKCCGDLTDNTDNELLNTCAKELNYTSEIGVVDIFDPCIEECIWKAEGYLTKSNQLNYDILLKDFKENPKQKYNNVGLKALETCKKKAHMFGRKEGKCKSGAERATHCNDLYNYMHCPNWTNSEECKATRQKLEYCQDKLLMLPFSKSFVPI